MRKTKIGVIGCGNISGAYLSAEQRFPILEVAAVADLVPERAQAKAAEFGIARVCSPEQLLADPEIEIVINLTIPKAHCEVAVAALEAGKNVHSEKPLGLIREDGLVQLDLAKRNGLRVGCAPDTFLGSGIQTCRKLIDDGWIGEPIGASAHMLCHGHESWHPDPEFYYKPGGGPMFDMGPYYLTALVSLLGPVRSVSGSATTTFPQRLITSQPKHGTLVDVEVPTHVAGVMRFANGAIGTIIMSFDVWAHQLPCIEIYGTEGTLAVPDPNGFGGPVRLCRGGEWREIPLSHGHADGNRGIGVADMAYALRSGRKHRASGELAHHVLDLMCAFHDASDRGASVMLESTCERPAALPMGLQPGTLDE